MVRNNWERFSAIPGGKVLFSKAIGILAAYTGTIDPRVEDVGPGTSRVHMADRRKVRNHLKSIHAVALANLAELSGSLALIFALPPNARMIVTGLSVEFLKKARGKITAIAQGPEIKTNAKRDVVIEIRLENTAGEVVSTALLKCLVGPKS